MLVHQWKEAVDLLKLPTDAVGRWLLCYKQTAGVPDWEVVWFLNGNVLSEGPGAHTFTRFELESCLYCEVLVPPLPYSAPRFEKSVR